VQTSSVHFPLMHEDVLETRVGAYQELGLSAKTLATAVGLSADTYSYKIDTVEYFVPIVGGEIYYEFINLLNASIGTLYGYPVSGLVFSLVDGDVRLLKLSGGTTATTLAIIGGTTGTDLLGASGLVTTPDSVVANIAYVKKSSPSGKAMLDQVRFRLHSTYNADFAVEVLKPAAIGWAYNFRATYAIASTTVHWETDMKIPCMYNDMVLIYTEATSFNVNISNFVELVFGRAQNV